MISGLRKVGLAVLAASGLVVGIWALLGPGSFYDSFPGLGQHWVSASGPYNEHLVTDVGAAYLALTATALLALAWADARICQIAGVAWAVFSAPHFYFHVRHLDGLTDLETTLQLTSLGATLLIAIWLALPARQAAARVV